MTRAALLIVVVASFGCIRSGARSAGEETRVRPPECAAQKPLTLSAEAVLALIGACPDARVLIDNGLDPGSPHWSEIRAAWLDRVKEPDARADTLLNASMFFMRARDARSISLLERAVRVEPNRSDLRRWLALMYGDTDPARAYVQMAAAVRLAGPAARVNYLVEAAEAAFESGHLDQADTWASEAVVRGPTIELDAKRASALHHGHIIRGKIALHRGDLAAARLHLAAACAKGPPVVIGWGPDLTLAEALLSRGEDRAVHAYLRDCARIYMMSGPEIDEWVSQTEKALRESIAVDRPAP